MRFPREQLARLAQEMCRAATALNVTPADREWTIREMGLLDEVRYEAARLASTSEAILKRLNGGATHVD